MDAITKRLEQLESTATRLVLDIRETLALVKLVNDELTSKSPEKVIETSLRPQS